jgi:hypothetical protein
MKTITIEKGKVTFYSSLSADTLVVNGVLKVNGTLKVRRLLGRGIVDARRLETDTVNLRTGFIREVEIGSGAFGEFYATTCKAKGTLCAKNFVQALEVSAKRLVVSYSNIGSCTAQEVVSLRRYLPNKLLSGLKRLLTAPFRRLAKLGRKKTAAKKQPVSFPKAVAPNSDPDNELVPAILEALREKGYSVSLIQEEAQAQENLRQKLGEVTARGQGLRSQLNDLTALEKQAQETYKQFRKEDMEKTAALLEQLRARKAEMEQELREHGEALSALNSQIQAINASLTYGNLDDEEMQRFSELHTRKQEAEEELAALEKIAARPAPNLDAHEKEADELIRQKKLLMSAAVNYLAARNELSFASLSMPQVKISLCDLVKTTGELKSAFHFQFNGRDYRRLSHSEKLRAGLEVSQLMKRLTGRCYPVFIDDVESITALPKLPDQILLARVVPNAPLSVVTPGQLAPVPLKKAS